MIRRALAHSVLLEFHTQSTAASLHVPGLFFPSDYRSAQVENKLCHRTVPWSADDGYSQPEKLDLVRTRYSIHQKTQEKTRQEHCASVKTQKTSRLNIAVEQPFDPRLLRVRRR